VAGQYDAHVRLHALVRVSLGLATASVLVSAVAQPVFACTTDVEGLRSVADGRGFTFIAQVVTIATVHDPNLVHGQKRTTLAVKRVFAGKVPDQVTWLTDICHQPRDFVVGGRYLLSTSDLDQPTVEQLVAWRVSIDHLRLIVFEGEGYYPTSIRRVTTISEAVALMTSIPDTSTQGVDPAPSAPTEPLFSLVAIASSLAVVLAFRRRYSSPG
jgi:hypothetical protein